ncbi:MAG: ATP-dependent RecD-like DNA helicase [Eubacterium sp.]|jgi:exodeoxyribonuclease V alpha subunit|nr:ATP-dependent RecD-like DNA helicase [Eubacterium sp.]
MEDGYLVLKGVVESVIYKNTQTGYVVFDAASNGELVPVMGVLGDIAVGEKLSLIGSFIETPKYGRQFKAEACERMQPDTPDEIRRYLASGIIKGLGPALAKKLTEKFGAETLEIIENQPERLIEIKGVTPERAEYISYEYKRICSVKSIIDFLGYYRISPQTSLAVWQRYEGECIKKIKKNPYILCEIGIDVDFNIADYIAKDYNIENYDPNRVIAAIAYVLKENADNGHTCLPLPVLKNLTCEQFGISYDCFENALESGITGNVVSGRQKLFSKLKFGDKTRIFLAQYYMAEKYIADKLSIMAGLNTGANADYSDEISGIEFEENIKYEFLQKAAINGCLTNSVFILTGGPGTGKTTTINAVIKIFKQKKRVLALAAPTGRAAKRMTDLTGESAKTIHRLLEVDSDKDNLLSFKRNEFNPLGSNVIIVDEMSMVDVLLFEALLRAIKPDSKLILIGDFNQLPSVGPGNVLKDLISTGIIPAIELKEIFRQAAQSLIVTNAHKIVSGELPELNIRDRDFFFMRADSDFEISRLVVDLAKTRLPEKYGFSALDDIQILSPTKMGEAGTKGLNSALQKALNPPAKSKREIKFFDAVFRQGDKVMQTKNDYEVNWLKKGSKGKGVFNGDIGIITDIDGYSGNLTINFDGRAALYSPEMLNKIEHAFAITVHKSQGSEYDAVIVPITDISSRLLYRNLLYTAVTRAKKILILIGRKEVVAEMVGTVRKTTRYSCIQGLMKENALKANGENKN